MPATFPSSQCCITLNTAWSTRAWQGLAMPATLPSSLCPITLEHMVDPCMAADGHSYERRALERWLEHSSLSPVTGKVLLHRCVVPNHALRNLITEATDLPGSSLELDERSTLGFMPSQHDLRRWLLGAALHALLHIVFRFPDVDLALSYACLSEAASIQTLCPPSRTGSIVRCLNPLCGSGQDHGALLV